MPSCDNDVLLVTNFVNIAMRPRPRRGQGWRKGGDHNYEKWISTEQENEQTGNNTL
jgi:hypothetical protein